MQDVEHLFDNGQNGGIFKRDARVSVVTRTTFMPSFYLFERSCNGAYPICSVTVRAINLCCQDSPEQLQFFSDAASVERKERIKTVVDVLRSRFGKYAI